MLRLQHDEPAALRATDEASLRAAMPDLLLGLACPVVSRAGGIMAYLWQGRVRR